MTLVRQDSPDESPTSRGGKVFTDSHLSDDLESNRYLSVSVFFLGVEGRAPEGVSAGLHRLLNSSSFRVVPWLEQVFSGFRLHETSLNVNVVQVIFKVV